jgi:beta-lactamase regulating signal transducer with metallopeptidase domain
MTSWLIETLVWTAVLIAAVLMLRRPVARWFGPQVAYALWAIPALRLLLPPIELPAWMRPAANAENTVPAVANASETQFLNLDSPNPVATTDGPAGTEAAAPDLSAPITPTASFEFASLIEPMTQLAIAVWLIGAAIFLYSRFAAYFRLRAQLLEGGADVGRDGSIRLVETPGTSAPLAFGVIDKVIALPRGFLAQPDKTARDLALAHEMQHHQGRDLLINVAVQPLFAMHWFNPLGRYGWLALRRDQEAACDARVIAAKPAKQREAYANLIVSTAARSADSPGLSLNLALAAPMACPVLGEKSIIHRLRSLNMTDTSHERRMAARLMLGAAIIALPLTATISYAATDVPAPPAPPAAPAALSASIAPPTPPAPPIPPAPLPLTNASAILSVDPDTGEAVEHDREETVIIIRDEDGNIDEERTERRIERQVHRIHMSHDGEEISEEQMEEIMTEMRRGLEEANAALAEMPAIIEEAIASAQDADERTIVIRGCDNSSDDVATTTENADGTRTVMVCQARVMVSALEGLREARDEIAESRDMSAQMRGRIVRELDQQITRWESTQS